MDKVKKILIEINTSIQQYKDLKIRLNVNVNTSKLIITLLIYILSYLIVFYHDDAVCCIINVKFRHYQNYWYGINDQIKMVFIFIYGGK